MRLVLFAPNIHTGGGLVLLRAVLKADELPPLVLFVDARALDDLTLPDSAQRIVVQPSLRDRFKAQWALRSLVCSDDVVLCLHGVPPLLKNKGRVVVFQQNRLVLGCGALSGYPLRSGIQIMLNRLSSRLLRNRVQTWVVQTPSMRRDLEIWHGHRPDVRVLPFADTSRTGPLNAREDPQWDFVFVSDGMPHKNHKRLLEAWCVLASDGVRPSLALTLGPRDALLAKMVTEVTRTNGLRVRNLGHLAHHEVMSLYRRSRALIFPSTIESFGLPLVEATASGLPIIAPELDYVRDVCVPATTFDAHSAVSIARAVRRFLGLDDSPAQLCSANDFVREVCR